MTPPLGISDRLIVLLYSIVINSPRTEPNYSNPAGCAVCSLRTMACTVHTAQHAARHDTRQGHKERAHGWSTSPTKSLLPRPGRKAGRGNGRVAQVNETVEVAWRTLVENHVT